ncbi:MAG: hypothetical protein M1833_005681 [Piccolia ochrophora]|nr:MAG: hypothetical protein M1833_005681 [Piccolia ochrophora]
MTALIKPWLADNLSRQLAAAARLSERSSPSNQSPWKGTCERTGDVVTITFDPQFKKCSRIVQILKVNFTKFHEPVEALISDSRALARCRFSRSGTHAFENSHDGWRTSYGTLGGLMQLQAFDIHVDLNEGNDNFTLVVHDCKYIGAEGTMACGKPESLASHREIRTMLELAIARATIVSSQDASPSDDGHDLGSSPIVQSQGDRDQESEVSGVDGEQNLSASPLGLATQHSLGDASRDFGSQESNSDRKLAKKDHHASSKNSVDVTQGKVVYDRNGVIKALVGIRRPPQVGAHNVVGYPVPSRRDLKRTEPVPSPKLSDDQELDPKTDQSNKRARKSSQPAHDRSPIATTRIMSMQHGPKSRSSDMTELTKMPAHTPTGRHETQKSCRSMTANQRLKSTKGHYCSPMKTTQDESVTMTLKDTLDHRSRGVVDATRFTPRKGDRREHDPWLGMVRISRRDVEIPKEQATLLSRPDCWIPPEPGCRGPVSNIPLSLVQEFRDLVEMHIKAKPKDSLVREGTQEMSLISPQRKDSSCEMDKQSSPSGDDRSLSWPSTQSDVGASESIPPDSSIEGAQPALKPNRGKRSCMKSPCDSEHVISQANSGGGAQRLNDSQHGSTTSQERKEALFCSGEPKRIKATSKNQDDVSQRVDSLKTDESKALSMLSPVLNGEDLCSPTRWQSEAKQVNPYDWDHRQEDRSESDESVLELAVPEALDYSLPISRNQSLAPSGGTSPPSSSIQSNPTTTLHVERTPNQNKMTSRVTLTQEPISASRRKHTRSESLAERSDLDPTSPSAQIVPATCDSRDHISSPDRSEHKSSVSSTSLNVADPHHIVYGMESSPRDQRLSQSPLEGLFAPVNGEGVFDVDVETSFQTMTTGHAAPKSIISAFGERNTGTKRKSSPGDNEKPLKKRSKRLRIPASFHFSQEDRQVIDPSAVARQQRRDFFRISSTTAACQANLEVENTKAKVNLENGVKSSPNNHNCQACENSDMSAESEVNAPAAEPMLFDQLDISGAESQRPASARSKSVPSREMDAQTVVPMKAQSQASSHGAEAAVTANQDGRSLSVPSRTSEQPNNIYNDFRCAYPTYPGTLAEFMVSCAYIRGLQLENRMEHKSLWDDFVFRHITDYKTWSEDRESGKASYVPYEEYYRDHVDGPACQRYILKPQNLEEVLKLDTAIVGETHSATSKKSDSVPHGSLRSPLPQNSRAPGPSKADSSPASQAQSRSSPLLRLGKVPDWLEPGGLREVTESVELGLMESHRSLRSLASTDTPLETRKAMAPPPIHEVGKGQESARQMTEDEITSRRSSIASKAAHLTSSKAPTAVAHTTPTPNPRRTFLGLPPKLDASSPATTPSLRALSPPLLKRLSRTPTPTSNPARSGATTPSNNPRTTVINWLSETTSGPPSTSRPAPPPLAPVVPKENVSPKSWWRDKQAPFKQWSREYASLKSVQGTMGDVDAETGGLVGVGKGRAKVGSFRVSKWEL